MTVPTSEDFILYTDASDIAWGGYLFFVKDRKEFISEYASGVFPAEVKKWISFDKEIYGVICCLKKFALKLMHLPKFIIRTDCTRFLTFKEKDHGRKDGRGKYIRWQAYLNQYNYEVYHIPGKENIVANYLSRHTPGVFMVNPSHPDQPPLYYGFHIEKEFNVMFSSLHADAQ